MHYFLSQDCSNGWSMGHTRLEFLPLLLCPCSQKSFFQGWWWCLQLSTGSWASPNISLDDYSNLEMCTFGRSSSFVCLFFVLFLSYHKASFHYFSRFQILAFKGYLEVSGRCLECVWGPQTGVVYCLGGVPINICHLLSGEKFTETSFQKTKYFALLTWSSGNTSFCLSSLLSK